MLRVKMGFEWVLVCFAVCSGSCIENIFQKGMDDTIGNVDVSLIYRAPSLDGA